jgi:hypothetical protein
MLILKVIHISILFYYSFYQFIELTYYFDLNTFLTIIRYLIIVILYFRDGIFFNLMFNFILFDLLILCLIYLLIEYIII